MGDYEGLVRNGPVKHWDAQLNGATDKNEREELKRKLSALAADPGASDLDALLDLLGSDKKHFEKHWLGRGVRSQDESFFALNEGQKIQILCEAYAQAMTLAEDSGRVLEICTTWVCLWNDMPPTFQVAVHREPTRVNVLLLCFPKAQPPKPPRRNDQDRVVWVGPAKAVVGFKRDDKEIVKTDFPMVIDTDPDAA